MTEQGVQEEAPDMFSDMLAFPSSKARSPQDFVIKFSGSGDLKASVTRPSGIEDDAEVVETGKLMKQKFLSLPYLDFIGQTVPISIGSLWILLFLY